MVLVKVKSRGERAENESTGDFVGTEEKRKSQS
jgi:hypothetical protein